MTQVERLQAKGILRKGTRRSGFRYVYADGRSARADSPRIAALRLPPAWKDVAINPSAHGRLQAVGRDAAGRWQYVYHAAHVRQRERKKSQRLIRFGVALPKLRRAVAHDLRERQLTRERVLATVVRILACAFIRPGSEAYAAENGSYGIATLRRKHVTVKGASVHFDFPAKSGKRQQHALEDERLARTIRRLVALPGYEVFKFLDDDSKIVDIRRADINDYIKRHMGDAFSAKDFRTWTATVMCACALARAGTVAGSGRRTQKQQVVTAIKATAQQLGNTPAICRSSYINPTVLRSYENGKVIERGFDRIEELIARRVRGLHPAEGALLRLLKRNNC